MTRDENVTAEQPAGVTSVERVRMSPKARRLAREHGLDPSQVHGSGPDGAVLTDDVFRAVTDAARARADSEKEHAARLERARAASDAANADRERVLVAEVESARRAKERAEADVARLVTELEAHRTRLDMERAAFDARRESSTDVGQGSGRHDVPHVVVRRDVDASAVLAACERLSGDIDSAYSVRLSHIDMVVAAAARALRQHVRMNAQWSGDRVVQNAAINIALSVVIGDDVVMPVIRAADRASLGELAQRRQRLLDRAESRQLDASDTENATFTISDLGMLSVDAFSGPVVGSQAGHLAVGAIVDRVIAVDGLIGVRPTMSLTLSCDQRLVHAARAAAFLNDVAIAIGEARKWT